MEMTFSGLSQEDLITFLPYAIFWLASVCLFFYGGLYVGARVSGREMAAVTDTIKERMIRGPKLRLRMKQPEDNATVGEPSGTNSRWFQCKKCLMMALLNLRLLLHY